MVEASPAVSAEVPEAMLSVAGGVALAGCADCHRVDISEADIVAVEAVGRVHFLEAGIVVLNKGNINTLFENVSISA